MRLKSRKREGMTLGQFDTFSKEFNNNCALKDINDLAGVMGAVGAIALAYFAVAWARAICVGPSNRQPP